MAGTATSIPRADFSQNDGGNGLGALPFRKDELSEEGDDLIVVFQVATTDPATFRVARAQIETLLRGQSVGDRKIAAVITDAQVETTVSTKQALAALITPLVARALGVTMPV